jgi:hypothetical protein
MCILSFSVRRAGFVSPCPSCVQDLDELRVDLAKPARAGPGVVAAPSPSQFLSGARPSTYLGVILPSGANSAKDIVERCALLLKLLPAMRLQSTLRVRRLPAWCSLLAFTSDGGGALYCAPLRQRVVFVRCLARYVLVLTLSLRFALGVFGRVEQSWRCLGRLNCAGPFLLLLSTRMHHSNPRALCRSWDPDPS